MVICQFDLLVCHNRSNEHHSSEATVRLSCVVHGYYASDCGIVSNMYGQRQYCVFVCLIVARFMRF